MADTLRIRSTLPLAIRIAEPHPNPDRPGDSPTLRQSIIRPGLNEFTGDDLDVYRAWSGDVGKGFVASSDDVTAGRTDGKVYELAEDEPAAENGWEPALDRAAKAMGGDASNGSTVTDPGPVPAEAMRTGSADAPAAPVLASTAPLKVSATADAPLSGSTIASTLPASTQVPNKVAAQPVPAAATK